MRRALTTCSPDVSTDVIDWALRACQDPQVGVRWRTRFSVPTRADVERRLRDAQLSLVFRSNRTSSIVSLVQVHDLDARFWHGQLSVLGDDRYHGSPTLGQSLVAGIAIAFAGLPLRKLYAEVLPLDGRRPPVMRHWRLEGRLVDHYSTSARVARRPALRPVETDFAATVPRRYADLAREWVASPWHLTGRDRPG